MEISLATLGRRSTRKHASAELMYAHYSERIGHFCRCRMESYPTEEKFFSAVNRMAWAAGSARPMLVLLDGRGQSLSTEQFAQWLAREREQGTRHILFAVGPADGWSEAARRRVVSPGPGLLLSLGPMTLPHELAAVVLAEQIYRAFTIIEGHPYHLGHV